MSVKALFAKQGMIIGDATESIDGSWTLKNPVIGIPQQNSMALIPILALMEENEVTFGPEDYFYGRVFTPTVELRNHYNNLFGTGIVEASNENILQLG